MTTRTAGLDLSRVRVLGCGGEPVNAVMNCGRPFPGHEVTVADALGARCPDRAVGEIWVRGPSVATGYVGDAEATARTFGEDGWLRTRGRGYLVDGELHLTGRLEDVLVVNGRDSDPIRLEWLVKAVPGSVPVVRWPSPRPSSPTEHVAVVVECRQAAAPGLDRAVRAVVAEHLALTVGTLASGPGSHGHELAAFQADHLVGGVGDLP
ncbi:AMP-binding protein [Streptomyces sp. NPDC056716]|uniref:AMP-binding protein n=1 Tax=unclassified Streptomyces TaxID=2593676 RepID=UPI00368F8953